MQEEVTVSGWKINHSWAKGDGGERSHTHAAPPAQPKNPNAIYPMGISLEKQTGTRQKKEGKVF